MATSPNSEDKGLEDAAILLMSLGEEEASEVFKHLAPKEVQRLGETIAKMRTVYAAPIAPADDAAILDWLVAD